MVAVVVIAAIVVVVVLVLVLVVVACVVVAVKQYMGTPGVSLPNLEVQHSRSPKLPNTTISTRYRC